MLSNDKKVSEPIITTHWANFSRVLMLELLDNIGSKFLGLQVVDVFATVIPSILFGMFLFWYGFHRSDLGDINKPVLYLW
jgi:hypothetical protein